MMTVDSKKYIRKNDWNKYLVCFLLVTVLRLFTNTYLLLTEFEGRTVSYGPSFFLLDLWPKREIEEEKNEDP